MVRLVPVSAALEIDAVRRLFIEYNDWLGADLCFQNFESELASLPGNYAPPEGRLFLARSGEDAAGCIALRRIDTATCEMKRLFLRPPFRRQGLGRRLAETVVSEARAIGYRRMRLDTLAMMKEAVALYRSMGFREIEPYAPNPLPGAIFMELMI